ncbi:MAG: hypothetical protein HC802_21990 [Caldilineaceae bacterium]|nr:hypothetical protein [Caldilineaceae bacterium]
MIETAASATNATLNEKQLGELLWRLVAVAHTHGLNAENALRSYMAIYRRQHAPAHVAS